MRQRRHGNHEEAVSVDTSISQRDSSSHLKTHRRSACAAALLVFAALSLYSLYHWWSIDVPNSDVFFSCRQIGQEPSSSCSCVYFRPTRYFFQSDQPGYQYRHIVEECNDIQWTMWGKQVSDFYISHARLGASFPNKVFHRQGIASVSTILMPKVASRSIEALFHERLSVDIVDRIQSKMNGPRVGIATSSFWKQLAERQEQSNEKDKDIVFTLLREPVSRFLSALAQTLSTSMATKHRACQELWKQCLETSNSYQQLVQCAIRSMQQRPLTPYFDVHVAPQSVFLAGALEHHDVEFAVFEMNDLETILRAFGMPKQQHYNTREEKMYSQDILDRFGEELRNPHKARKALDDKMIQDICELYAMDVSLMHHLGFSAGDCDS